MIESYRVGAVFELRDEASPALRALYENASRLEKLFGQVTKAISGINEVKLGGFTEKLGGISEKLSAIRTKAEGMGTGITQSLQNVDTAFVESGRKIAGFSNSFDTIPEASRVAIEGVTKNLSTADAALATSTRAATELATALREAGAASRDIPRLPRSGSGGGAGGGGSGAHPRPGQGGGSGGAHGGNTFGSHGSYIDAGILGTIGAHEVAQAVEATLHRGMEMSAVQNQMLQGGMTQEDIDKATASAWKIARADGLDVTKVMDDIKELRLPFGSTEHALNFIEPLEKMRIVLNSVQAGTGTSASDAVYKMARAGELKGLQNPEDFLSYFEGMTKAISASGGKVTPNDFAQATKYGKLSSFGLSEDFYTRSLPTMIQTMGPTTAGQSLQSLFGTLSGSISEKSFHKIDELGLIADRSKIVQTKTGTQLQPGAIEGYDEFVKNPLAWAKDHLVGHLESKFGSLDDPNNKEAILGQLQGMFGNRNSAAAVAELALRSKSFDKDAGLIDQARGLGGAESLQKNDPTTAMNNFKAAWDNLLTSLGGPAVKPATDLMTGLAGGMNRLGEFMQAHPTLAKDMEGMAAGVVVGLGAIAVIGLAAFAPGGVIAVGAAALTGALMGLAAVNWGDVTGVFDRINAALTKFFTGLVDMIRKIPGIGRLFDETGPVANANGAPLTPEQKAWLGQHPGGELPDELTPSILRSYRKGTEAFGPKNETLGPAAPVPLDMVPGMGLFSPMAYRTGGTSSADNDNLIDTLAQGVFRGLKLYAGNPGGGDAAGVGGGFTNASYTTYGDGAEGGGGSAGHSSPSIRYGRQHSSGSGSLIDGPVARFGAGSTFAQKSPEVMSRLMGDFGLNPEQAAKILGNLGHESMGFKAFNEIGGGGGIGWAQWTGPRNREYRAWAAANHLDPHSDEANYGFLRHELKGRYASGIEALKHGASLEQFERIFEGAGIKAYGSRHAYERAAMDAYRHRPVPVAGMNPQTAVPISPQVPIAGPPPQAKTITPGRPAGKQGMTMASLTVHSHTHLDGKRIATDTTHHQVAMMEHPNSIGDHDGYGFHGGPGTALNDAA